MCWKSIHSNPGKTPGTLQHPLRSEEDIDVQLSYSEPMLDWIVKRYSSNHSSSISIVTLLHEMISSPMYSLLTSFEFYNPPIIEKVIAEIIIPNPSSSSSTNVTTNIDTNMNNNDTIFKFSSKEETIQFNEINIEQQQQQEEDQQEDKDQNKDEEGRIKCTQS